jgi:hypothetical protein
VELTATLRTDAGMHAVWDRHHFTGVVDYPTWEAELLEDEDIERHIAAGHLVPINIRSDGTFVINLRADEGNSPVLAEDERARVLAASDPYRFACSGHVDLSGIEYVVASPSPPSVASADLAAGAYAVRVYLLDWDDLATRTEANPDFVLLVGPARADDFRRSVATF